MHLSSDSTFIKLVSNLYLNRKMFGDGTSQAAATTQKLRITTKTAYRLMMKQVGSTMGEGQDQVDATMCSAKASLLTTH